MDHVARMTAREIALVQADFAHIAPGSRQVAERFYATLFAQAPWTEHLFAGADLADQAAKLATTLAWLVAHLGQPATLGPALAALGRRHADLGVTAAHYEEVGRALLSTLRESLGGADWPAERMAAWVSAYRLAATAMQGGATEPASATTPPRG